MKFRDCTSMNSTENIQEGSRNGLSKTAPEFEKWKPCAYQHACEIKLPGTRLITRSQLGRFLQNVMTINFRD